MWTPWPLDLVRDGGRAMLVLEDNPILPFFTGLGQGAGDPGNCQLAVAASVYRVIWNSTGCGA
jgi:hypothetical protein